MHKSLYETHVMSDPLLPFIFHRSTRLTPTGRTVFSNWHTNLELLNCVEGEGTVLLDGKSVDFRPGDTVCVNTNVIHRIVTDRSVRYHCLIIGKDFCAANGIDTEKLRFEERFSSGNIDSLFGELISEYVSDESVNVCRRARIRSLVLRVMIDIRENHTVGTADGSDAERLNLDRVRKALDYIHENYSEPLSLESIARRVGISRCYFSRTFKGATGFSVIEYINSIRCREARLLIEGGSSVSEAAVICGFENMSYFTRTFKKCMGVLPSKFREAHSSTPTE